VKVLLTGHRGRLGPPVMRALERDAHAVRGFDWVDGDDVMDAPAVARVAEGIETIVHLAGIAGDRKVSPSDMMAVHMAGTANVLFAAEANKVRRVVYLSSGRSLGLLEREPDYLPMDDNHRGLPSQPYALAKWLSEEMCEAFTARTGVETLCIRAVAVFDDEAYAKAVAARGEGPVRFAWHLGVHIDMRDLADGVAAAVRCASPGHARALICARDIGNPRPTLELLAEHLSHVPWRGGPEYRSDPYRSLVDTRRADALLKWRPAHTWPGR
jgi:nucleoside-diphosphate-sugar epimerase